MTINVEEEGYVEDYVIQVMYVMFRGSKCITLRGDGDKIIDVIEEMSKRKLLRPMILNVGVTNGKTEIKIERSEKVKVNE